MAKNEEKTGAGEKKIVVDAELCIGCGSCEAIAPDHFKLDDSGKSKVIKQYSEEDKDIIESAKDSCPVGAISIS
jgi:ferredoxin